MTTTPIDAKASRGKFRNALADFDFSTCSPSFNTQLVQANHAW